MIEERHRQAGVECYEEQRCSGCRETIWEKRREKSQGINVRLEMGPEAETTGSRNSWRGIVR